MTSNELLHPSRVYPDRVRGLALVSRLIDGSNHEPEVKCPRRDQSRHAIRPVKDDQPPTRQGSRCLVTSDWSARECEIWRHLAGCQVQPPSELLLGRQVVVRPDRQMEPTALTARSTGTTAKPGQFRFRPFGWDVVEALRSRVRGIRRPWDCCRAFGWTRSLASSEHGDYQPDPRSSRHATLSSPQAGHWSASALATVGYGLSVLSRPSGSIVDHGHEAPQRGYPVGALRICFTRRPLLA